MSERRERRTMADLYPPKPHIVENALLRDRDEYDRLYRQSLEHPEEFWAEQAKRLHWFAPWNRVMDADYREVEFSCT